MAKLGNVEHLRTERHALLADPYHTPGVALALLSDETGRRNEGGHEGTANHTFNAACNVGVWTGDFAVKVSARSLRLLGISADGHPQNWGREEIALAALEAQKQAWHGRGEACGYQGEMLAGEALLRAAAFSNTLSFHAALAIRRRAAFAALMQVRGAREVTCLTLGCRVGDAHDAVLSRLREVALGHDNIPGLAQNWAEGVRMVSELTGGRRVYLPRLETIAEIVEELRVTELHLHPARTIEWWGAADGSWWAAEMASLDGCVRDRKKGGVRSLMAGDGVWVANTGLSDEAKARADWYLSVGSNGVEVLRKPSGVTVGVPSKPSEPEVPEVPDPSDPGDDDRPHFFPRWRVAQLLRDDIPLPTATAIVEIVWRAQQVVNNEPDAHPRLAAAVRSLTSK